MTASAQDDEPFWSTWDEEEGQIVSPLSEEVCRDRLMRSPHKARIPHLSNEELKFLRWTNIGAAGLQTAVYCDVLTAESGGAVIAYRVGAERLTRFGVAESFIMGGAMMVLGLFFAAATRSWFVLIWVAFLGLLMWGNVLQVRGSRIGVKGDGAYLLDHIASLVEGRPKA